MPWYVFHNVHHLPNLGNNRYLNDLEDTFKNWKTMNYILPRMASVCTSFVGGQGSFQCKCKGNAQQTNVSASKMEEFVLQLVPATVNEVIGK
jgi:hypothetical protein